MDDEPGIAFRAQMWSPSELAAVLDARKDPVGPGEGTPPRSDLLLGVWCLPLTEAYPFPITGQQ